MTEVELAKHCVDWLKKDGWEVYQEACVPYRADIVAVKGKHVKVIEAKKTLNFGLLVQGLRWCPTATEVYLLTPPRKTEWDMKPIIAKLGMGWMVWRKKHESWDREKAKWIDREFIDIVVQSPVNTPEDPDYIIKQLDERMKDYAPAGSSGTYWTPFKRTMERMIEYVKARPKGVTARELEAGIEHHYQSSASARGNFVSIIEGGFVKGLTVDRSERPMVIKPVGAGNE